MSFSSFSPGVRLLLPGLTPNCLHQPPYGKDRGIVGTGNGDALPSVQSIHDLAAANVDSHMSGVTDDISRRALLMLPTFTPTLLCSAEEWGRLMPKF